MRVRTSLILLLSLASLIIATVSKALWDTRRNRIDSLNRAVPSEKGR